MTKRSAEAETEGLPPGWLSSCARGSHGPVSQEATADAVIWYGSLSDSLITISGVIIMHRHAEFIGCNHSPSVDPWPCVMSDENGSGRRWGWSRSLATKGDQSAHRAVGTGPGAALCDNQPHRKPHLWVQPHLWVHFVDGTVTAKCLPVSVPSQFQFRCATWWHHHALLHCFVSSGEGGECDWCRIGL